MVESVTIHNHNHSGNTNIISALNNLQVWLGIVPPYNHLSPTETDKKQLIYKWYIVLLATLLVIGNGFSIWGKCTEVYSTIPSQSVILTDIALNLSMFLTNMAAILVPTFWCLSDSKLFMQLLYKKYSCIQKDLSADGKDYKQFYVKVVIGHITLISIFAYEAYAWITGPSGLVQFRHYIFQDLQYYHSYIMVMIMYKFSLAIRSAFRNLNKMLSNTNNLHKTYPMNISVDKNTLEYYINVRQVALDYQAQTTQINLYNNIFGWQILFFMLSIMVGFLDSLGTLIVYTFLKDEHGNRLVNEIDPNLIVLDAVRSLWQLILISNVADFCSKTTKEAKRTADVCFNILLRLPKGSKGKADIGLREELMLLNQMAIHRCPSFSAAGFFSIDYFLLLAIFESITSYVIVLIQLSK